MSDDNEKYGDATEEGRQQLDKIYNAFGHDIDVPYSYIQRLDTDNCINEAVEELTDDVKRVVEQLKSGKEPYPDDSFDTSLSADWWHDLIEKSED